MSEPRRLHLNYFHSHSGSHEAAWRDPDAPAPGVALQLDHLARVAQIAEAACLDSIFLPHGMIATGLENSDFGFGLDPPIALAAIAGRTGRIGLIGTASTTFSHPFDLAQRFSTLDHVSGGRAGWNMVTSTTDDAARNFGLDSLPEHDERYARAAEFVDTCLQLWDSWEDDAIVDDREAGVYADSSRVHRIGHAGAYYAVEGPLCVPPSPQRYPLRVQAGASDAGKDFAARYADAVFSIAPDIEAARAFYSEMHKRTAAHGRPPGSVKVMPGLAFVLGDTEQDARARERELQELVIPERGVGILEAFMGVALDGCPLDGPVPELPDLASFKGGVARMRLLYEYVARERPTIRQLAGWFANQIRGHGLFVGTAEQLADRLREWLDTSAADGFNLLPPLMPGGLERFCAEVVPILQERGLFRTEYTAATLREHYGV
ncbi:MAG TPA: LLM class flavin-dependent oxidoreductase [Solirubrobacteraceae bacterium]|nr:LLM class flavin-dependent oxidoreductase [Solirubrobacteraceae bacterium]